MTTFASITIFLIMVFLGFGIYMLVELIEKNKVTKQTVSYKQILPDYYQKNCEIRVKNAMPTIDIMYSIKGIVADMDDEWVMIEVAGKKKTTVKIMKIENINGIKEID